MNLSLIPIDLQPIAEKVENRQRITDSEALQLYRSNDLNALGIMASTARAQKNGNVATYIHNRYINYSNICVLSCQFCAFAAKKRDAHAFEHAIDEIIETVREALRVGVTEVHMVGGLHPTLKKEWYLGLVRGIRSLDPGLHIKAFTAIEIRHLARRVFRMSIKDTLETLREAGLGSMTGGGAEIFDPVVRDQICRGKETAEEWLDAHRTWHKIGGRSTCTMLYGHIETLEHRVDHLRQLRELQDETGGFTGFVPFAFEPQTTILSHIKGASAVEQLRNLAVSRIYLDNVEHLTAYWVSMGLPLAQVSLSYGVDDLHGTILEERIFHMAGATTPQQQTAAALEHAIREAGREPAQRDSHYRRINSSRATPVNEVEPVEPNRPAPKVVGQDSVEVTKGPRIGCVKYLNARPLIHGWPGDVTFDHPSRLCQQLAEGALEVALVSSFEFLRNPIYIQVDDVCVSSHGPVYSVFLAHAGELAEIAEIEVDPASLTSVNLLRCLLAEAGLTPKLVTRNPLVQRAVTPRLAKFLIGDQAIRFRERSATALQFWDLGEEWQRLTHLPFVYALWLIRPEVASSKAIADGLRARRDKNLRELDIVIAAQNEFSPQFCAYYFRKCLTYRFGELEGDGLSMFRKLCEKHGILPPNPTFIR